YRELFDLHATAESLADPTKRRTIVRFVRSLVTASEQIRNDPTVVYPLMTGPTGVSQSVLAESFKYERYAGTLVSDLLDQLVTEEVWHAKQNNRTARSRTELAKLVDTSVLQDALAQGNRVTGPGRPTARSGNDDGRAVGDDHRVLELSTNAAVGGAQRQPSSLSMVY